MAMLLFLLPKESQVKNAMEKTKAPKRGNIEQGGSWKAFAAFFRHAKLSWGWIILSLAVNVAYYSVVAHLPGSTAALFAGNFSREAFSAAVVNYSSLCVLQALVSLTMLIAASTSVRSVRSAVW